jgi:hypothetical protein
LGNISNFPDAEWDRELLALNGHVLQSSGWLQVQRALGHEVCWSRGDGWQWAGAIRHGVFPRYLYVPYGPAGSGRTTGAFRDIVRAASRSGLDFVRVEPTGNDALAALDVAHARAARPVQPRCTWLLDLTVDEDALRAGLESGHRSRINAAPRRGITVRSSDDPDEVDIFLGLQRLAAGRSGFGGQSATYHHAVARVLMPLGMARLYVAEAEGAPVSASICFDFGPTRYYAFSASDPERGRKLGAGPPLLWTMILDARARGAATFDFWGVLCTDQPGHGWTGFSQFKRAFGGRLLQRAGTWEIAVRRLRYRAFTVLKRSA